MKKLMTMIAAVATAFGLYATDFAEHTISFTGMTDSQYDLSENEGTTGLYWTYDGQAKGAYTTSDDLKVESDKLTIKTGSKVLSRKFVEDGVASLDGTNLFFQGTINFKGQALDEVPTLDSTAKFALFALDTTELVASGAGTNLYVIAAYGNGLDKKLYKLYTGGDDGLTAAWLEADHEVTIKVYDSAYSTCAGFMVYIDGTAQAPNAQVAYSMSDLDFSNQVVLNDGDNYLGAVQSSVQSSLSGWVNERKLFLSLTANQTLTSVDFVGNAAITSVKLTDVQPGFIPEDAKFVTIDTTLSYTVTVNGKSVTPEDGKIYGFGGETVVITVTSDLTGKALTSSKGTVADNVITYELEVGETIAITAPDAAAYVDGKAYADFAKALTAACGKEGAVLKLTSASTLDEALSIESCNNMTLDLAGQTITAEGSEIGVICVQNGALTITNSVPTAGGVTATAQNGIAVNNIAGDSTVAIYGGQFDGAVQNYNEEAPATVTYTGISIFDGAFSVKTDDSTIPSGKKWCEEAEKVDGYWVLVDKPTEIDVPTAITGLVYDNTLKTGVEEGEGYTLTGNTATEAGEYEATAALKPGYAWKTTFDGKIAWIIAAAPVTPDVTVDPTTAEWSDSLQFPTVTVAGSYVLDTDYTVAWDPADLPAENPVADTNFTVTVTMKGNYTGSASATFTVTPKAGEQKGDPDEPQHVTPGTEAATAEEWNKNIADHLNVPACVTDSGTYCLMFEAVSGGEGSGEVKIQLKDSVKADIADEVSTSEATILAPVEGKATITARPGLWYGLKAQANLEDIATAAAGQWTQATGTTVQFTITQPSDAKGFYQVDYSASHKE